jgi:hypothetical protein
LLLPYDQKDYDSDIFLQICAMNLNYRQILPEDFAGCSRVWIYQSNRLFTLSEVLEVESMLHEFVKNWNSHGAPVKGFATVFLGQFILLMADETASGVSGCSTDSSVRLIKDIEGKFSVSLFDRHLLAFIIKDKIQLIPLSQLNYAFDNGFIDQDTLYINNTVLNKSELESHWIIPVKRSWLTKKLTIDL